MFWATHWERCCTGSHTGCWHGSTVARCRCGTAQSWLHAARCGSRAQRGIVRTGSLRHTRHTVLYWAVAGHGAAQGAHGCSLEDTAAAVATHTLPDGTAMAIHLRHAVTTAQVSATLSGSTCCRAVSVTEVRRCGWTSGRQRSRPTGSSQHPGAPGLGQQPGAGHCPAAQGHFEQAYVSATYHRGKDAPEPLVYCKARDAPSLSRAGNGHAALLRSTRRYDLKVTATCGWWCGPSWTAWCCRWWRPSVL